MSSILLVDDDPDVIETTALILRDEGHDVVIARNGAEGLAALARAERHPDLVILDLEMPILDGPGMAHRMFLHDLGQEDIPIIVVSGAAEFQRIAARVGTPYRLSKPYRIDALLGLVERALAERAAPHPPDASIP